MSRPRGVGTVAAPGEMIPASEWIWSQIGSREHYAIPRALCARRTLRALLTDAWVRPGSGLGSVGPRRLRERFHSELPSDRVCSWNLGIIWFELRCRAQGIAGWERTLRRNRWFQSRTVGWLERHSDSLPNSNPVVFAYSYAARDLFAVARAAGFKTILGQIDAGPVAEELVGNLHRRWGPGGSNWWPAPSSYWQSWRQECDLADCIVVNSQWSQRAIALAGVDEEKIEVVPLAYAASSASRDFRRLYPPQFTKARPLRVMFLGQVSLGKGIMEALGAFARLQGQPVELQVVGPDMGEVPSTASSAPNIRWVGPVARSEADRYYREADVFLFPTHSDGFGITQLEAQAWKLPIIASRFCGEVVEHGRNGIVLDQVSAPHIAEAILGLIRAPASLAEMSDQAVDMNAFSLSAIARRFIEIGAGLPPVKRKEKALLCP